MHRYTRLLLTSLAATAFMALAVSSATAGRFEPSSSNFRVVWASLELGNTAGIGSTVRCRVTLEGTFHSRTILKVARSLIGYITSAEVDGGNCTGGTATVHRETLPWHLTYESFGGTLPNGITELRMLLIGADFEINTGGVTCSARTESRNNASGIAAVEAGRAITTLTADRNRQIPLTGGFCSLVRGFFNGAGTVTVLGGSAAITVRLI